jgi:hypothetical protein
MLQQARSSRVARLMITTSMDEQLGARDEHKVHPSWLHNDDFNWYARSEQSRYYREWRGKQRPDMTVPSPSVRAWKYFSLQINFDILCTWLSVCRKSHGASCGIRPTKELSRYTKDLVLIDLRRMCLVTLPCSTSYVALSYVWGKDFLERNPDSLLMNEQNLKQLERPSALARAYDQIPKTVQDATNMMVGTTTNTGRLSKTITDTPSFFRPQQEINRTSHRSQTAYFSAPHL